MTQLRASLTGASMLVAQLRETQLSRQQSAAARRDMPAASAIGGREPKGRASFNSVCSQLTALLQDLEVAIAERDYAAAVHMLDQGYDALDVAIRDVHVLTAAVGNDFMAWKGVAEARLLSLKQMLLDMLETAVNESGIHTGGAQSAASVLARLAGRCHAASVVLGVFSRQIVAQQQQLRKQMAYGSVDSAAITFGGSCAQATFMTVSHAATYLHATFGPEFYQVTSVFSSWAVQETKKCGELIALHALHPFGSPLRLQPAMQCVALAIAFCAMAEQLHKVTLRFAMMHVVWPHLEAALAEQLPEMQDAISAAAQDEVTAILNAIAARREPRSAAEQQHELASSVKVLDDVAQLCGMMLPVAGPHVAMPMRRTVQALFTAHVVGIADAIRNCLSAHPPLRKVLNSKSGAVAGILGALAAMVETHLPRMTARLAAKSGVLIDQAELDKAIDLVAAAADHRMPGRQSLVGGGGGGGDQEGEDGADAGGDDNGGGGDNDGDSLATPSSAADTKPAAPYSAPPKLGASVRSTSSSMRGRGGIGVADVAAAGQEVGARAAGVGSIAEASEHDDDDGAALTATPTLTPLPVAAPAAAMAAGAAAAGARGVGAAAATPAAPAVAPSPSLASWRGKQTPASHMVTPVTAPSHAVNTDDDDDVSPLATDSDDDLR